MDSKQELIELLESRKRTTNIFSLLTAVSVIVVVILFFQLNASQDKVRERELRIQGMLDTSRLKNDTIAGQLRMISEAKRINDSLSLLISDHLLHLQFENDSLRMRMKGTGAKSTQVGPGSSGITRERMLNADISKMKGNEVQTSNLMRAVDNSKYLITIHAVGANESDLSTMQSALKSKAYAAEVGYNYSSGDRPSWMATSPSVLYYDAESKHQAQEIARILGDALGVKFSILRGSGFGVVKGQEKNTVFIHFLRDGAVEAH